MPQAAIAPAIMGAATIGSSALGMFGQKSQNEAAEDAADDAMRIWWQTAFPRTGAVQATKKAMRNQLGQARTASYGNMFNQMAGRGFGAGSGAILGGAQGIERNYMSTLGNSMLGIQKWAHTPQWSPPGQGYPTAQQSPLGYGAQNMSGMMDTALGYYMMMQMMNKGDGGATSGSPWDSSTFYNQNMRVKQ